MSNQLVLFKAASLEERFRNVFASRTAYAEDKNGNEIVIDGQKVQKKVTIAALPKNSENGQSLAKVTGLKGAALDAFQVEANRAALDVMFEIMRQKKESGLYVFKSGSVDRRGHMTMSIKPCAAGITALTDDQVLAMAKARGFVVAENPTPGTPAAKTDVLPPVSGGMSPEMSASVAAMQKPQLPAPAAPAAPAKPEAKKKGRKVQAEQLPLK